MSSMSFFRRSRNNDRQRTTSTTSTSNLPPPPPGGQSSSSDSLPDGGDGRNDTINASDYARKCARLMELYRSLRSLGITTFLPDLPRVVVIGAQSSGKSSLVEAVSGIKVPRDAGTCTRCPMECIMSSDASSWSCTISLRTEYDTQGRPQIHQTEDFVREILNESSVELWVRRAQAAILNPHRPRSDFLTMSEEELKRLNSANSQNPDSQTLKFSKNVVVVHVKDPGATDLSFVDLPGLIQNAEENLIDTVRSLVENYIKQKNTVIVIAMPMSGEKTSAIDRNYHADVILPGLLNDYENMQAVRLAGQLGADPDGERTIGVLTKPDTLQPTARASLEKWKAVLEGTEHATTHGYYCVRLPDEDERTHGISKAEAQRTADNFFSTRFPWSDMADRRRFGIPNFVTNVSALLVLLIEANLPSLRERIAVELEKCIREIEELPPVSHVHPSTEVMLRVTEFCKGMQDAVLGERYKEFVQANKRRYALFEQDIRMTTPDFRPFENVTYSSSLVETRTEARSLVDVRNVIKASITWELPRHIPFEATKVLVSQYTALWTAPSITCFESVVSGMSKFLDEQLHGHFGQYTELEKYLSAIAHHERDICRNDALNMLQKILRLENNPLFSQNSEALRQEEEKWYKKYNDLRLPQPVRPASARQYPAGPPSISYSDDDDNPSEASVSPIIHNFSSTFGRVVRNSPRTWGDDAEIKVMANVMGYFQVAYKRIIDYVPLIVEHELNQTFASKLSNVLIDRIFQDSREGRIDLESLLQEDPELAARRRELAERKICLTQIKNKLDEFEMSSGL
ncbi:unnamed protein product [Cyclocybe aegerita]|uniref:Uncharacterized protein n=1 Tax=Cyclocybe aegerita TaxID=1973307 RepID=A0A8S0XRG4_CYCAE|nr:unnamed protein product [Cyclocybe aegerita]